MIRARQLPVSLFPVLLALASGAFALSAQAAGGGDVAQEYEQVRKIALRDPRVKDGFDRANERLTQKIIELDPALKAYAANHGQNVSATVPPPAPPVPVPAVAVRRPFVAATPAPTPSPSRPPKHAAHPVTSGAQRTHLVASGETIAGIAHRYNVSAASIEAANHISDPRKLRAGDSLIIPGAGEPAAAVPRASSPPAPAPAVEPQQDGVWDKLKHSIY